MNRSRNKITKISILLILMLSMAGSLYAQDVDISKEVVIQISYWNLQEGALLYRAIHLKDQMDTWVFSSSNLKSISLTART